MLLILTKEYVAFWHVAKNGERSGDEQEIPILRKFSKGYNVRD